MGARTRSLSQYFRSWQEEEERKRKRQAAVRLAVRRYRARKLREDPEFFKRAYEDRRQKNREARERKRERMAELREMAPLAIERGELPPGYHYWSGAPLTKEMLADIWELHYRRGGKPFDEMQ